MLKHNLPTYAIVELLIRLEKHNPSIGNYKDHSVYDNGVIVKTSSGSITLPQALIVRQFEAPELITEGELGRVAALFRASS